MTRATKARRRAEIITVSLALVLVAWFGYGSYVANGGFYVDDWADLAGYQFAHPVRYWSAVSDLHSTLGGRALEALLLPIPEALFGAHPEPYLGLALALGIATSLCFYVLLRTLSMRPLPAAMIAVLALLFPWSDSVRLWATASVTSLAVCFFCLGVVVAIRGLRRRGRAAVAMHAAADVLYLLSVLTYEAAAAAALLAGLLYIRRAPPAMVARRWLADVVVVLGALVYSLLMTVTSRHVGSLAERVNDLSQYARQAALLLASALFPVGALSAAVQAIVLLALVVVAGLTVTRLRRRPGGAIREWAWWAVGAAVALGASYLMFLGSALHPIDPGLDNRTNVLAGLAYCLLVYAVVATATGLVMPGTRWASAVSVSATCLIAIGYVVHLRGDESAWARASRLQHVLLAAVHRGLPVLPHHSTVLTFNHPSQTAPEVPVFDKDYDLRGALDLQANDRTLHAYPIFPGVAVRCQRSALTVAAASNYGTFNVAYGSVYFLDVGAARGQEISSSVECRTALRAFRAARGL